MTSQVQLLLEYTIKYLKSIIYYSSACKFLFFSFLDVTHVHGTNAAADIRIQ
jgi:hypothetical protein